MVASYTLRLSSYMMFSYSIHSHTRVCIGEYICRQERVCGYLWERPATRGHASLAKTVELLDMEEYFVRCP